MGILLWLGQLAIFVEMPRVFLRQTGDELKTEQRVADLGGGPRPARREFSPLFTFPRLFTQTRDQISEISKRRPWAKVTFRGPRALSPSPCMGRCGPFVF